jgi:hypothetical protein
VNPVVVDESACGTRPHVNAAIAIPADVTVMDLRLDPADSDPVAGERTVSDQP